MQTKLKRKAETKRKLTIASNSTADRVPLWPVRRLRLGAGKNNDIELEGLRSAGAANSETDGVERRRRES